jgi:hypothetical protein
VEELIGPPLWSGVEVEQDVPSREVGGGVRADGSTLVLRLQLAHPPQVGGALAQHHVAGRLGRRRAQRDDGLAHDVLGTGGGRRRGCGQPLVEPGQAGGRDGVDGAFRSAVGAGLDDLGQSVAHQAGQGRVDLAEGQRLGAGEPGVVLLLHLVAVPRAAEQERQVHFGEGHDPTVHPVYAPGE